MNFWHDMKKESPEFGRKNFLVLGIRGGLYLAPRFERSKRNESDAWFRDTRGHFIHPDKVLAWAEVPPFDIAQADAKYNGELEQLVKELEGENIRLRSLLSNNAQKDEVMALCSVMYAFIRPLRRDDNTQAIFDYFTDKCKELGIEVD